MNDKIEGRDNDQLVARAIKVTYNQLKICVNFTLKHSHENQANSYEQQLYGEQEYSSNEGGATAVAAEFINVLLDALWVYQQLLDPSKEE